MKYFQKRKEERSAKQIDLSFFLQQTPALSEHKKGRNKTLVNLLWLSLNSWQPHYAYYMVAEMEPQESPNKKMQEEVDLVVTLPSSTPIVGVPFTPQVYLHGAPETFLQFQWCRLLNDKKVNCHLHKLEKAIVQCRTCVRLNIPIQDSYHCSAKCYYDKWEHHRERHSAKIINSSDDDQNREDYTYDLQNLPLGISNAIVHQERKFWLEVGSFKTYVPSKDDFGCILRLNTLVIDSQLVLKGDVIITDRVIVNPPTHTRIMIGIEPFVASNVHTRFRILSYNILADMHVPKTGEYNYCPTLSLDWVYRRENLVREIVAYEADILCLQEVQLDHFENFLKPEIERHGYSVTYKGREPKGYTSEGLRAYGCATFYHVDKFRKVQEYEMEFGKFAQALLDVLQPSQREIGRRRLLKDNVAILTILELVKTKTASNKLNPRFCVVNTHICASEQLKDVKLWQVATLINEVEKNFGRHIPILLCGDLNSRPGSAPYHLVVHGEVDHAHLEFPDDPVGIFKKIKLSHKLSLVSAYSKMNSGTGETQFTHFSRNLKGTLDYIFYQEDKLVLKSVLELLQINNLLPSTQWSSDHLALMADFEFK